MVSTTSLSEALLKKYSFLDFPTEVQLERVRDEKFQALCKDLWPNIYKQMEKTEQADKCKDLVTNLEKRILSDTAIINALENKPCCSGCEKKPESFAAMDAALAGKSNYTVPNINIYINGEEKRAEKKPEEVPKSQVTMSSYNYPFCTSSYSEMREKQTPKKFSDILGMKVEPRLNPKDEDILNSIKETQEKLKMTQRIQTTTELVDDLINKFGKLQAEMKEKTAIINAKSDLQAEREKIDKEFLMRRSLENIRSPFVSPCRSLSRESRCTSPYKSLSQESLSFTRCKSPCRSPCRSRSREIICKSRRPSVSPVLSCARRPRSCSREHRPLKSCLKRTKSPGVASISYRITERRPCTMSASSADTFGSRDFFYVAPKVNCWNNKPKVDSNIY